MVAYSEGVTKGQSLIVVMETAFCEVVVNGEVSSEEALNLLRLPGVRGVPHPVRAPHHTSHHTHTH